jgi:hypothetical protein
LPNYNVENKETGEYSTVSMPWVEFEDYLKNNPQFRQVFEKVRLSYRGVGDVKVPEDFNSILKKIKKDYPGSTINPLK